MTTRSRMSSMTSPAMEEPKGKLAKGKKMQIAFMLSRTLVACILLLASVVTFSQREPGSLAVDIPFDFMAGGEPLPAGHYIVAMQADSIKIFRPQAQGIFVLTHAGLRSSDQGSKLIFHRYEDTYFLSAVCVSGARDTRELVRSPAERKLAGQSEMELAVVRATR